LIIPTYTIREATDRVGMYWGIEDLTDIRIGDRYVDNTWYVVPMDSDRYFEHILYLDSIDVPDETILELLKPSFWFAGLCIKKPGVVNMDILENGEHNALYELVEKQFLPPKQQT